ncbi:MAG: hypothetical protein IPO07_27505 [Haliscomenobacter sp.]|nr:hypothetical protein [Haliscomenobacter sp.]MBK9492127.1 hypothetical protein [Haliscomenobacter sp.]
MKNQSLNKKLKADHQSDEAVWMGAPDVSTVEKDTKNERFKKQFAQDVLIHERIKYPVRRWHVCFDASGLKPCYWTFCLKYQLPIQ